MLPNSITKLQNLQVLKLAGLRRLKQLPKDIKKLVDLMHLDLWKCDGLTYMPPGLGQLTSLRYLTRFLVAKDDGISKQVSGLGELHDLNNLRGLLEIMNLRNVKNPASAFRAAKLKEKQHLQTLKLAWKPGGVGDDDDTESGSEDAVSLEELKPHQNLQWLDVRGWGRLKFPSWVASLTSLVELRIDNCIKCHYLPSLNHFPSLKYLTLDELSDLKYIESGISCNNSESGLTLFFPSLEKLWLRNCPNLKGWCRKETSSSPELFQFHCLSYLEIKNCPDLTSMPLIPTVEKLVLKNANKKFIYDILKLNILLPQSASSSSSSESLPSFVQLKELSIQKIADLDFLPEEFLPKLASMKKLDIIDCSRITTLSQNMEHLATLQVLVIRGCDQLDLSQVEWQHLKSLKKIRMVNLSNLAALPQRLQHATTLQQVEICHCPVLQSLPEWINELTELRQLEIKECPLLSKRCRDNKGEDWLKVSRIPNIKINGQWIKLKGFYEL